MQRLKRNTAILLAVIFIISLSGCSGLPKNIETQVSPAQTVPESTETVCRETPGTSPLPSPSPEATPTDIKEEARFSADLDGDGTDETIIVSSAPGSSIFDDIRLGVITKTVKKEIFVSEGWFNRAYLTETRNGQPCVLISCDFEDELTDTLVCSFNGISPALSSTRYGLIENVKDTHVTISAFTDFIGEWYYTCEYDLAEDFTLKRVSEYMIDMGSMEPLHTIRELPVEMLAEGKYIADTLPVDTHVYPVSCDGNGHMTFRLEDGSTGRITYSQESYPTCIDGRPEDEYFDNLVYWG